jgi:SAM-dependent methyltransferase
MVETGNQWTVPVDAAAVAQARQGRFTLLLTPTKAVPADWLGEVAGRRVLCLASGGGQQGPLLAAAGARVTVLDNSPRQLDQDRLVATREALPVTTVEGDMRDLSGFDPGTFDLIVHPVSNCFVPDVRCVWREAFRVLRAGGRLLSGFANPVLYVFDEAAYAAGETRLAHPVPYSDAQTLPEGEQAARLAQGTPLEFGHTLEDQVGGQLQAGFVITGLYEDALPPERNDLLSRYLPTFMATRAERPAAR